MKKKLDTNELRKIQMDILDFIDSFCRKHNIQYSLSGGSLIGAIRHKGFIPWDDDIDIMMTRYNYEKFYTLMHNSIEEQMSNYRLLSYDMDKKFRYPFMKVEDIRTIAIDHNRHCGTYGVFVDIFPFDIISDDDRVVNFQLKLIKLLISIYFIKRYFISRNTTWYKNIVLFFVLPIARLMTDNFIIKSIIYIAKQGNDTFGRRRCCLVWGYGAKEIMPMSVHEAFIDIQFEDRTYMAIKDYNTYLTCLFGDYMQLPPIEKQKTHHVFEAYWR